MWAAGRTAPSDVPGDAFTPWLRRAEELLAVEVTRYLDWVLRHVRRLALLLLFMILFTTGMLEALPFPYHALLTTGFIVLVIVPVGTVVLLMLALARDDVLSRINGTDPGRINWNTASLVSALVFVAVPVISLLGTEVEPVGEALFGWVQGLLRLLSSV